MTEIESTRPTIAAVTAEQRGDDLDSQSESDVDDDTSLPGVSVPRVVKFAYVNFRAVGKKWSASCKACKKSLTTNAGVTSVLRPL